MWGPFDIFGCRCPSRNVETRRASPRASFAVECADTARCGEGECEDDRPEMEGVSKGRSVYAFLLRVRLPLESDRRENRQSVVFMQERNVSNKGEAGFA